MRLIHLEIRLDFAEEIHEYSLEQKVYKAITGKMPTEAEQKPKQPVLISSPKRKQSISWDTESSEVILEQVPNINNFVEIAVGLLSKIDAVAPIGKLSRRTFVTYWLLPALGYDFSMLEQKYRGSMISQKPICQGTIDSSVLLDINISGSRLHHQSGPMKIKQLFDDYLLFKLDDIPEVFLFLWASIEEEKVVEYSNEEMQGYLLKSFNHCKSHSEAFEQIWEGIL